MTFRYRNTVSRRGPRAVTTRQPRRTRPAASIGQSQRYTMDELVSSAASSFIAEQSRACIRARHSIDHTRMHAMLWRAPSRARPTSAPHSRTCREWCKAVSTSRDRRDGGAGATPELERVRCSRSAPKVGRPLGSLLHIAPAERRRGWNMSSRCSAAARSQALRVPVPLTRAKGHQSPGSPEPRVATGSMSVHPACSEV